MDHPAVAVRIRHLGREEGGPGVLDAVRSDERGQGLRAQERRVTRQDDDVLHLVVVVGQAGQSDGRPRPPCPIG